MRQKNQYTKTERNELTGTHVNSIELNPLYTLITEWRRQISRAKMCW